MPNFSVSEIITHLTTAQNLDNARPLGDRFKLPAILRADLDADLAELLSKEQAITPAAGGRAGASATRRTALEQLKREHDGGYRFIQGLDETTLTPGQRLQVYECYGWASGEIGVHPDARAIEMARLAPTITAAEAGNAAWLYPAARLARIAAQLAIVDATEAQASGGDAQSATLARDSALDLAATTLLRVRFFYCSATRDADQTPELVKIGYQPRRDPGTVGGNTPPSPAPALPGAPQNAVLTTGIAGSGEAGIQSDGASGIVDGYLLFNNGAQVATSPTLPVLATFTPGEALSLTLRAFNTTGTGDPSDTITGDAP